MTDETLLDSAAMALQELGLGSDLDPIEQMRVFASALEIYEQRELTYGSAWKDAPLDEFVGDLDKKTRRIAQGLRLLDEGLPGGNTPENVRMLKDSIRDSAVDIANYAAFIYRRIDNA